MRNELTVVIPVYNVEKYLSKCIESILNQTLPVDEIILVDDGSKDRSGEIADEERVNLENDAFIGKMKCVNNYEASLETFLNSKPLFHGYDSFTEYALKNGG